MSTLPVSERMKVLWITNNPLPAFIPHIKGRPALGGSWLAPLAKELTKENDIDLAIVTNVPEGEYQRIDHDGITQFTIPIEKKNGLVINDLYPDLIRYYRKIENEFAPDVIHIHGTERYFGLLSARNYLKAPAIISIQGIITSYYDYLLGGISEKVMKSRRSIKNIVSGGGIINQRRQYEQYIPLEKEILRKNNYFFCRTSWDRSQVNMFNNNAVIHQGEELLRDAFYHQQWSFDNVKRNSIFISSGTIPIKGLHVLLEAASLLRSSFPDLLLRIPLNADKFYRNSIISSNDYEIYLNELISKYDLKNNIDLLGTLDENQMARIMSTSHVFVLPSFNENSPNSLGEAMMIGTPSVVSPVGGVPDMVKDNESALFAHAGDSAMLGYRIKQIFDNDSLALTLSENAKLIANKRHDKQTAVMQYKEAYHNVMEREFTFAS